MTNPVLSIVTGTVSRLPMLQNMILSARRQITGIPYEIIVVDGGSKDGTQDWCKQQSDIRLIEHGELRGAIQAFDDGAYAARGEYVLLANDDILFEPGAILAALAHLDSTPTCGGVAFADNRPAPGFENIPWHVQSLNAIGRDHERTSVIYAQVGLFRRWLGDMAGWWGSRDRVMGGGKRTYGGDCFLSARIWEMGYTVDALDNCRIRDLVPHDDLREHNYRVENEQPGRYYVRYPQGPKIGSLSTPVNPQSERLRVLYFPIYEPTAIAQKSGKRGLREAFARRGLVVEVDYVNDAYDLPALVEQWQPHLLFLQCHSATSIPASELAKARAMKPDMVVANWNGDVYENLLTSEAMFAWLRHVDLQLVVNHKVVSLYESRGIPSAYWQVAWEPVNEADIPPAPALDVVFLANCYSPAREELGKALGGLSGANVGIYGRGWPGLMARGDTTYNFPAGCALYRASKIAIGDNQYPDDYGFVSNRLFEALANGAFLLHQRVPGLQELTGIQDGVHYVSWNDLTDLQAKIKHWLKPRMDSERQRIALAGREFVRSQHSFDARLDELVHKLLPKIERIKV